MSFPLGFLVVLHMKVESPNRLRGTTRGARMGQIAKAGGQRDKARAEVLGALGARRIRAEDLWPVHVELTRVSAGTLDDDNLRSALKDRHGGDWDEWPQRVPRVREFPRAS